MAVEKLNVDDLLWHVLQEGIDRLIVQCNGTGIQLYIGDDQPTVSTEGFDIVAGTLYSPEGVSDFGSTVWVRSKTGYGSIKYAVHLTGVYQPYSVGYVDDTYFTP